MNATLTLIENLRENLRDLSPHAPEWGSNVPDFVAWLNEIASEKEAERVASDSLREALLDARERFSDDLRYLGLDASRWDERGLSAYASANVADVLEIVENFKIALSDYHSLPKERGETRQETRRMMALEDTYADRVETLHRELDGLLAPLDDDVTHPKDDPSDDSPSDPDAARPAPQASLDVSHVSSPAPPRTDRDVAPPPDAAEDAMPTDDEGQAEDGGENEIQEGGGAEIRREEAASATAEAVGESAYPPKVETAARDADEPGDADESGEETEAEEPSSEPTEPDLPAAMWEMVGQDDLAGAYWIAKSLESQGRVPPVPAHLLKAAQGARWLSPNSNAYVNDLFEIANSNEGPNENDIQILMGLASALQASAVKDGAYLQAWLKAPQSCPEIDSVSSPLRDFVVRNGAAKPEYITGSAGLQGVNEAIAKASADASGWLNQSQNRSPGYKTAAGVLYRLCADGGKLREMLGPVANDARDRVARVKEIANDLAQNQIVEDIINQIHGQARSTGGSSSRLSRIVGPAKSWLVNRIREAKDMAVEWSDLVERAGDFSNDYWMTERVSELRDAIDSASEEVFAALSELASDSQPQEVSASARCVIRAMERLIAHLGLSLPQSAAAGCPVSPAVVDLRKINSAHPTELDVAVARRLVWTPAVKLDDYGDSDESALVLPLEDGENEIEMGRLLAESLRAPLSLNDALRKRVEDRQDFRFYDVMSSALSDSQRAIIEPVREKRRRESEDALAQHVADAKGALDQVVRDGVMEFDDPEWKSCSDAVDDIERPEDEGGSPLAHVMDFQEEHRKIQYVLASLGEKRDARRADLSLEWDVLLADVHGNGGDCSDAVATWEEKFSQANSDSDIRVMETCVSRLRSHRSYLTGDGGERLVPSSEYDSQPIDSLETFMEFMDGISDPKTRAENSDGLNALLGGYQ